MGKKKDTEPTGDCFQRAYHLLTDGVWKGNTLTNYCGTPHLVHGWVWHEKRGYHVHGWVEDNIYAYDFLRDNLMMVLKDRYYILGKIEDKPGRLIRYTQRQARAKVTATDLYYFGELAEPIN